MTTIAKVTPYLSGLNQVETGFEVMNLIVSLADGWNERRNIKAMTASAVERMKNLDDGDLSKLLDAVISSRDEKMLEIFFALKKLQMEQKYEIAKDCSEKNSQFRR